MERTYFLLITPTVVSGLICAIQWANKHLQENGIETGAFWVVFIIILLLVIFPLLTVIDYIFDD